VILLRARYKYNQDNIKFTHQFLLQTTSGVITAASAQASGSFSCWFICYVFNNCDIQPWI